MRKLTRLRKKRQWSDVHTWANCVTYELKFNKTLLNVEIESGWPVYILNSCRKPWMRHSSQAWKDRCKTRVAVNSYGGIVQEPWKGMFCGPHWSAKLRIDNVCMSGHGCISVELCCLDVGIRPDVATSSI